jgi:hypothetical protein
VLWVWKEGLMRAALIVTGREAASSLRVKCERLTVGEELESGIAAGGCCPSQATHTRQSWLSV